MNYSLVIYHFCHDWKLLLCRKSNVYFLEKRSRENLGAQQVLDPVWHLPEQMQTETVGSEADCGFFTFCSGWMSMHLCFMLGRLSHFLSFWFYSGPKGGSVLTDMFWHFHSVWGEVTQPFFCPAMTSGKLPGIKGLMSGSQGKRRFKSDLSVDMISPPMGDFRHTMHVGRGGDVFGDTSFLSNYGGFKEPGSPDSANSSKSTGFFTRTFRHVRRTSTQRPRGGSRDLTSQPPEVSPIIKNAVSLPQLNIDSPNGCLQRVLFPSSISSTDSFCTYGEIIHIITSYTGSM